MRELNDHEVSAVSGGCIISSVTGLVGTGIGKLLDLGTSLFGKQTDFTTAKGTLDKGLGQLLELNFSEGINNISTGISGLVSSIGALFSSK